jgi:FAD/FMN-containing dehydrogenase
MDPEGPTPSVSDSVLLADLPADAVAALVAAAGPDSGSRLLAAEIRHLGGALGRPGEGALAALPGGYLGFFVAIAPTDEAAAAGSADAARAVEALAPWASGGRCLNFDDADRAVDASAAYRAEDWGRLQRIRSAVDPHRRLVANHAV